MRVAATAGAGGYPGADDPVQKYADFPIDAERKQAVIRAQSALELLPESTDVSLRVDDGRKRAEPRFSARLSSPLFVACSRVASMFATST